MKAKLEKKDIEKYRKLNDEKKRLVKDGKTILKSN